MLGSSIWYRKHEKAKNDREAGGASRKNNGGGAVNGKTPQRKAPVATKCNTLSSPGKTSGETEPAQDKGKTIMTGGESGNKAPVIKEKDPKTGDEEQSKKDAEAPGMEQEEKQKLGQAKDNNVTKCEDSKDNDAVREAKEAGGTSGSVKSLAKPGTIETWKRLAAGTQR